MAAQARRRVPRLLARDGAPPPGAPDIEGMCLGAVALARFVGLYPARGVDRETAELLERLYGFETGANSLWNARRAVARRLGPFVEVLEDLMPASGCVHVDETGCPRADCGGKGHAWAASCPWAAMIIFHRPRSGDIFDGALRFLPGAVAVVDGCVAYGEVFREIRRCWRHIVDNPRAAAARAAGAEAGTVRALYGRLCGLYGRIRDRDTASESERRAILKEVQEMATALPEGRPSRIEILNAGDALATFPKCKDMPPTNNPGEGVVGRGPVRHRNVGCLLRSAEGAEALGALISLHVTCMLQGLDPVNTLIRILKGERLQCIFKAAASLIGPRRCGGIPRLACGPHPPPPTPVARRSVATCPCRPRGSAAGTCPCRPRRLKGSCPCRPRRLKGSCPCWPRGKRSRSRRCSPRRRYSRGCPKAAAYSMPQG